MMAHQKVQEDPLLFKRRQFPSPFVPLDTCIQEFLPRFAAKHRRLHVDAITQSGTSCEYPAGQVNTCLSTLSMHVRTSDLKARGVDTPREDRAHLIIVYLGLTGWNSTLAFVRELSTTHPTAHIIGVTCDCDARRKADDLVDFRPPLPLAVMTPYCGGRGEMAAILNALRRLYAIHTAFPSPTP